MRVDMDTCEEILVTITRNKTRSLLTAFGVFWGIFMLVALIGGGQGMQQAMSSQFEGFATNSAFLVSQKTGEAYKGFRKGRWWNLELSDIERLRNGVAEIDIITPSIAYWGRTAVHGDKKYECSVKGFIDSDMDNVADIMQQTVKLERLGIRHPHGRAFPV